MTRLDAYIDALEVAAAAMLAWGQDVETVDARRNARRPYDPAAAWNQPILSTATPLTSSAGWITSIADNNLPLTCDPDQYTMPVYLFDGTTRVVKVVGSGFFSTYDHGDNSRIGGGTPWTIYAPIPAVAQAAAGTDAQLVVWDPEEGVEWAFWQLAKTATGFSCTNGYRYHTGAGYYGRFADGKAGRGAGVPYLAGLVRPWEVARGRIDHALAFAYKWCAKTYVYPASKSDGLGTAADLPEGSRLQLDPARDIASLNLTPTAQIIAKALQDYGAYVVDNSGSSKVFLEDRKTAGWPADVTRDILAAIPWSWFRVVAAPAPPL